MHVQRRAFTLIELLIVVAILGLLIAIILPTLRAVRESARSTACLSNLRSIGLGALQYASEDDRENVTPLHGSMLYGDAMGWLALSAAGHAWAGAAASEGFHTPTGVIMLDETWSQQNPDIGWGYGARERPLTLYLYPEVENSSSDLQVFHCPSDRGVPPLDPSTTPMLPVPPEHFERPLFETTGNSYEFNTVRFFGGAARFSFGPLGQRLGDIPDPSRQTWITDPLVGAMFVTTQDIRGWHDQMMRDNSLYVDGSARTTDYVHMGDPRWTFPPEDQNPPIQAPQAVIRGPGYQMDCYPTPGVAINGFPVPPGAWGWPWLNHREIANR